MRAFTNAVLAMLLLLGLNACCSKKGACPIIEFNAMQLVNFDPSQVSDSVKVTTYAGGSNFSQIISENYLQGSPTATARTFNLNTGTLSVNFDYEVNVIKAGKKYKISAYTVEKVACGKCFMRTNNQFGYNLTGYSVNGKHQSYESVIQISQ
jgi:hypothetical protein